MKITIIGGAGRIGRCLAVLLVRGGFRGSLNLVTRERGALKGLAADLMSDAAVHVAALGYDNLEQVRGSDLILCVVGALPTPEQVALAKRLDSGGRFAQAFANKELILWIARQFGPLSPKAHWLNVTNQSDLTTALLRRILDPALVFGFGNMLDSRRLRRNLGSVGAMIIGYHTDRMVAVESTIEEALKPLLSDAFGTTLYTGSRLTAEYKLDVALKRQKGSVYGPAACLADCALAFSGQMEPLCEPFNILTDADASVGSLLGMGLPVTIGRGAIRTSQPLPSLTHSEERALGSSRREMLHAYELLVRPEGFIN